MSEDLAGTVNESEVPAPEAPPVVDKTERELLNEEAIVLGIKVTKNMKDETVANKIAEAKGEKPPEQPKAPASGKGKCPKGSPAKGDKDPAVLGWYKKNRPDIYKSKGMEAFVTKNKIKLP
jgi:hypothetical protein